MARRFVGLVFGVFMAWCLVTPAIAQAQPVDAPDDVRGAEELAEGQPDEGLPAGESGDVPDEVLPEVEPGGDVPDEVLPEAEPGGDVPDEVLPADESGGDAPDEGMSEAEPGGDAPDEGVPAGESGDVPDEVLPEAEPGGDAPDKALAAAAPGADAPDEVSVTGETSAADAAIPTTPQLDALAVDVDDSCDPANTALDETQCRALIAVGRTADGDRLFPGRGWPSSDDPSDPCTWRGVVCRDDNVVELVVPKAQMRGTLSPAIGELVHLVHLEISNVDRDQGLTALPLTIGNLTQLHTLRLQNHRLTSLPVEIRSLAELNVLDLRRNDLSALPASAGSLNQLTELDVSQNDLRTLPDAILRMRSLEELRLATNSVKSLPSLAGMANLEDLDISNTWITELPPLGPSIREIDADDARLSALPEDLGSLTTLEVLDVGGNDIAVVPSSIGNLASLRRLDLSENRVSELPAEVGALTALKVLDVRRNQLWLNQDHWAINLVAAGSLESVKLRRAEVGPDLNDCLMTVDDAVRTAFNSFDPNWQQCDGSIPPPPVVDDLDFECPVAQSIVPDVECAVAYRIITRVHGPWHPPSDDPCAWSFVGCRHGRIISIRITHTHLNEPVLSAAVRHLTALESLSLSNTKLTNLPAQLSQNVGLQTLHLRANQLTTLPDELSKLPALVSVDLSNNPMETVPAAITTNPNVTEMIWEGSLVGRLDVIPNELVEMVNLRRLYLRGNLLTSLPAEIGQLVQLQTLDLSHNRLQSLPAQIASLTELEDLHLRSNPGLGKLPDEIAQLRSLRILDVSNTGLDSIAVVQTLPNLRDLNASGNELDDLPVFESRRLAVLDVEQNRLTVEGIGALALRPPIATVNLRENQLTGDFTEVARQLAEASSLMIHDGLAANDCLTVTDASLARALSLKDNRWGRCDFPDDFDKFASCAPDITDLDRVQCEALIRIGRADDGQPVFPGSGWNVATDPRDPCTWQGVNCDEDHVESLIVNSVDFFRGGTSDLAPIGDLVDLEELRLREGGFDTLPASLGSLTKLHTLQINRVGLTSVDPDIGILPALRTVDLRQNSLQTVPQSLFQQPAMESLLLWANPLNDGLPSMAAATALRTLDVGASSLRRLPAELPARLELIRANNADLIELPATIDSAVALTTLDLHGNKLSDLPVALRNLRLNSLDLSDNRFSGTLPEVVGELPFLSILDATRNQLQGNQDSWAIGAVRIGALSELALRGTAETNECMASNDPAVQELFERLEPGWASCADGGADSPPDPAEDPDAVCPSRYRDSTFLPAVECAAVVAIARSLFGDDWRSFNRNLCGRGGPVNCERGRVTELFAAHADAGPVPADIGNLTALKVLSVASSDVSQLPDEITQLHRLERIVLTNSAITTLPTDLSQLVNLRELRLGGNPLDGFPAGILTIPNLHVLDMSSVGSTVLDGGALQDLQVVELNLADNELASIPDSLGDALIYRLDLHGNQLTSLPPSLMTAVQHVLDVSENNLGSLPGSVGSSNIRELDVSSNNLASLPPEMADMPWLGTLKAESNGLSDVGAVRSVATLVSLDFSDNDIAELPVLDLPLLRVLDVDRNRLTSLPEGLENLAIDELDASFNAITELPPLIGSLGQIDSLNLNRNLLSSLPDSFASLRASFIGLRGNGLTELPENIGALTVRDLMLAENRLVVLPESFGFINDLLILDLSDNRLTELPVSFGDLLANRGSLVRFAERLYVQRNRLRGDITPWVERAVALGFDGTYRYGRVFLGDGAWKNDCMTVTNPDLVPVLETMDRNWDRCDNP